MRIKVTIGEAGRAAAAVGARAAKREEDEATEPRAGAIPKCSASAKFSAAKSAKFEI